ncbi:MAG: helix-turn-helix domain-containing protein [Defluviitaleaceae bacterium]|nr:helix-turn-helix domain-containing protein [Defluviitaleaceae bacterium]
MAKSQEKRNEKARTDTIVGKNIRNTRKARKISMTEMAHLLDVSPSHMGLLERGERGVTAVNLARLKSIFDVPLDTLFGDSSTDILTHPDSDAQAYRLKINSILSKLSVRNLEVVVCLVSELSKDKNSEV